MSRQTQPQHSFLRRALQIRKNGARPPKRSSIHFSMICAGTPRPNGEERLSCYEIGDERSGSLADLPGAWGRQRPMLQSLPATCAAGGAKPEVSQSASQTDLVESEIQASRRRGDFCGREPVDQSNKSLPCRFHGQRPWAQVKSVQRGGVGGGSRSPANSPNQNLKLPMISATATM